ncbi:hypothetical protein [Streptomyces sp. NPDC056660]|uniref:hypothetical protein n=1 Tax=Streptomyces sp. NPDC056660 TaxID=3345897 RepID=UPI003689DE94
MSGTGTLVLAKDSTFTLPHSRQHQRVQIPGGNHPYVVVGRPDEPAVIVDAEATLQYGTGGTTGLIGSFPYNTPGYQQNQDNIRVDGTLRLSLTRLFNLGIISGSGLVTQPRNMWGTLQICGTNPFSGIFDNGTVVNFASTTCAAELPNARTVVNRGSWIIDTPLNHTVVRAAELLQPRVRQRRQCALPPGQQGDPHRRLQLERQRRRGGAVAERPRTELAARGPQTEQARHQYRGRRRPVGRRDHAPDLHALVGAGVRFGDRGRLRLCSRAVGDRCDMVIGRAAATGLFRRHEGVSAPLPIGAEETSRP